jgi:hypothetical protein
LSVLLHFQLPIWDKSMRSYSNNTACLLSSHLLLLNIYFYLEMPDYKWIIKRLWLLKFISCIFIVISIIVTISWQVFMFYCKSLNSERLGKWKAMELLLVNLPLKQSNNLLRWTIPYNNTGNGWELREWQWCWESCSFLLN